MTKLDNHCPLSVRVDALARSVFPLPSLKFRTAGFPQYGFKSDSGRNLRRTAHTARLICGRWSRRCAPVALTGNPSARTVGGVSAVTVRSRGPWLACGLFCPAGSSLTMASSEALGPSRRFMSYPAGLCRKRPGSRDSPIYSTCPSLRAVSRTPSDRAGLGCGFSARAALAIFATARHPNVHASRFTRGRVTRLQSSLDVAARRVARPSSTRAFTFELSSHESPRWNVEYNYAGNQPISRGRTFTGWTRSITGCERRTRRKFREVESDPVAAGSA
jgi:hypothetical protein